MQETTCSCRTHPLSFGSASAANRQPEVRVGYQASTTNNQLFVKDLPAFYTRRGNNFVSRKQKSAIFANFLNR
jgi:hypothetical protein